MTRCAAARRTRARRWARRGMRPRALAGLRTKSADLFGAICPERGTGAAVIMPRADTQAMQHHRDEIARNLAPKGHAIIVPDQAGWHTTGKLRLPENLSLMPLPPKSRPNPPSRTRSRTSGNSSATTNCQTEASAGMRRSLPRLARLGTASSPNRPALPRAEPARGQSSLVIKDGWY
jgi:hypothetical protein